MLAAEKTEYMKIPSDINFDWYCVVFPSPPSPSFPFPHSLYLTLAEVCDAAEKGLCWHKSAIWILLLLHCGTIWKLHPHNCPYFWPLCLHLGLNYSCKFTQYPLRHLLLGQTPSPSERMSFMDRPLLLHSTHTHCPQSAIRTRASIKRFWPSWSDSA